MRKAYFIRYRETREAEFYVLADSKEEAIEMVEEVPECIESDAFETSTSNVYCDEECDLTELGRLDKIYNIEFERVSYPELVSMIDKGGEE